MRMHYARAMICAHVTHVYVCVRHAPGPFYARNLALSGIVPYF